MSGEAPGSGPLAGVRVLELSGIGPGPFCGMLLADMGAEVVMVERPGGGRRDRRYDLLNRSKRSVVIDLKTPEGAQAVLALAVRADLMIDPFRPGVTERIGVGPKDCHAVNSRLVYGRMTGWGQDGPLSQAAGHDLNYISLSGALHAIGPRERPVPPLNLLGDFGGGALYLAVGLLAALNEAQQSGRGQVVDAAMCDGTANLMTMIYGFRRAGIWDGGREENLLDGGEPFYRVYRTADDRFISLAPIEPAFYDELVTRLALDPDELPARDDPATRDTLLDRFEAIFLTRTQSEWCDLLEGTDVCFAPVLDMDEAPRHPHNVARSVFVEVAGTMQPSPAPRFDRTPSRFPGTPPLAGSDTLQCLSDWGVDEADMGRWTADGTIVQRPVSETG